MADRWRHADDAMATLARERGAALTGYGYLLTGDMAAAEDLVQDALVKVFVRARDVDPAAMEAYVRRAMVTTYVDGWRRRRRWDAVRHLLARPEERTGDDAASADRVDVRAALRALPPRHRVCMVLRYHEDLTAVEIADRLGLGVGTVKRYLSDATARMQELLGARVTEAETVVVEVER